MRLGRFLSLVLVMATVLGVAGCVRASDLVGPAQALDLTEDGGVTVTAADVGGEDTERTDRNQVVVYLDYACPPCASFDAAVGDYLADELRAGRITLEYRVVAFVSRDHGSDYSSRAANAALCVLAAAGGAGFHEFSRLVLRSQPSEEGPGLSDDELTDVARTAGARDCSSCIRSGTYRTEVRHTTRRMTEGAKVPAVPTVTVNGRSLDPAPTVEELRATLSGSLG